MTDFPRLPELPAFLDFAAVTRPSPDRERARAAEAEARQLRRELDELQALNRELTAEKNQLRLRAAYAEPAVEALRQVLALFTSDPAGWARSVHVSAQDLAGWRAAERAARR